MNSPTSRSLPLERELVERVVVLLTTYANYGMEAFYANGERTPNSILADEVASKFSAVLAAHAPEPQPLTGEACARIYDEAKACARSEKPVEADYKIHETALVHVYAAGQRSIAAASEKPAQEDRALNLLRGLHKVVLDLAPHFEKPITDDNVTRWLALNSAQAAVKAFLDAPASADRSLKTASLEELEQANAPTSSASPHISEEQIAELLVDLELVNYMEEGVARHRRKKQYERIRAFLISLAPNVVLPEHEAKPALQAPKITEMVDRFLAWPLPASVCSDGCATNRDYPHPRSGTNLLTADEARQMLEHVLQGTLVSASEVPHTRETGVTEVQDDPLKQPIVTVPVYCFKVGDQVEVTITPFVARAEGRGA